MSQHDLGRGWMYSLRLSLLSAALICGCRSQEGPDLVPVTGRVSLDGSPLAGVGVSFRADASKGNTTGHIPTGVADAAGKYELETVGRKGAVAGWYKVVITPFSPGPVTPVPTPPYHMKFTEPSTTDLSIEVKVQATPGAYDLKLSK